MVMVFGFLRRTKNCMLHGTIATITMATQFHGYKYGRGVESQICIHGVFEENHTQYQYIMFPVAVLCCYDIFYVLFEF